MIDNRLTANIIESGSNSNGNYVKYEDGTLIQYLTINKTRFLQTTESYTTVQNINVYRSGVSSAALPMAFIDDNYVIVPSFISQYVSGASILRMYNYAITQKITTHFQMQLISLRPFTETSDTYKELIQVDAIAIGRWK